MNTTARCLLAATALALPLLGSIPAPNTPNTMPPGFHVRTVTHQINDCGPNNKGQVKVIIWRGSGDRQSALFCPNGTVWPS